MAGDSINLPENSMAVIFVLAQPGEVIEVQLRPVKDALPYDRPLLARLLREMADTLDGISAERQNT